MGSIVVVVVVAVVVFPKYFLSICNVFRVLYPFIVFLETSKVGKLNQRLVCNTFSKKDVKVL